MNAHAICKRLGRALIENNPSGSVQVSDDNTSITVGSLHVQLFDDRAIIGPRLDQLTDNLLHDLADPGSAIWCVVRLNDADFGGRVARLLRRHGIQLPDGWMKGMPPSRYRPAFRAELGLGRARLVVRLGPVGIIPRRARGLMDACVPPASR